MVGLNLDQASNLKLPKDPPDAVDPRPVDLSFVDSLLDFDSIDTWFGDFPNPDMTEAMVKQEQIDCEVGSVVKDEISSGGAPIGDGSDPLDGVVKVKVEGEGDLSCCIEEELGKVSLVGGSEVSDGLEIKVGGEESKMESGSSESSESESESSSASSSCSSSDDESESEGEEMEEEKNVEVEMEKKEGNEKACELEEGEISGGEEEGRGSGGDDDDDDEEEEEEGDEVAWSDVDIFDEGDEEEEAIKGPIRSKNELEVKNFVS